MPALFGYLVAVSMLLGGAYAGLQWLSAPEPVTAEKSAAPSNNAPERSTLSRTGAVAPNAADRERNAGTPAKMASTDRSDEIAHEAKHSSADTTDQSSKLGKADGVPARGCAPIGLTANGDLVFSMQCQDIIDRHRGELASPEIAQTAPASAQDQAARSAPSNTSSNDGGKATPAQPSNHDARDGTTNELAAKDATGPSNRASPNSDEVARRESNNGRAQPPTDHGAPRTPQDTVTTRESRSSGPNPDPEIAPGKSAKQKRPRPGTILRAAERHDAPREQRSSSGSRSRTMAARADSELWYNVLGLR
jgi:hypothetical protein